MKGPQFIRFAICGLLSLLRAAAAPPPVVPPSEPEEKISYYDQVKQGTIPLPDILAHLQKTGLFKPGESYKVSENSSIFRFACEQAKSEADLATLRSVLLASPEGRECFYEEFHAFALSLLRQKLAHLKAHPIKVTLPAPPKITGLPKEYAESMRVSVTAFNPFLAFLEKTPKLDDGVGLGDLEKTLRQILALAPGVRPEILARARFMWLSSGSFVRTEHYYADSGLALWLLETEKYAETMGALWQLQLEFERKNRAGDATDLVIDSMVSCGVPWETAFLGMLVSFHGAEERTRRLFSRITAAARINLALRGSEDSIRECLRLTQQNAFDDHDALFLLITAALGPVPEDKRDNWPYISADYRFKYRRPIPLSAPLHREVLAAIGSFLAPSRGPAALHESLSVFPAELAPEFQNLLRDLLPFPSRPIAQAARGILIEARLADEQTSITPPHYPLRFRLDLPNRLDLPGRIENLFVSAEDLPPPHASVDTEGRFSIPLGEVVDPDQLRSVTLRTDPTKIEVWDFSDSSGEARLWSGPWFEIDVPIQPAVDQEYPFTPELTALRIIPQVPPGLNPEHTLSFFLTREIPSKNGEPAPPDLPDDIPNLFDSASPPRTLSFSAKPGLPIQLERLQPASYQLRIFGPETATVKQRVKLGRDGLKLTVPLHLKHQIKATVVYPDGKEVAWEKVGSLQFANGDLIPYSPPGGLPSLPGLDPADDSAPGSGPSNWPRLSAGKYRLVVPSTEEGKGHATPQKARGRVFPLNATLAPHRELLHPFEVTDDSPITIDLGKIALEAAKK